MSVQIEQKGSVRKLGVSIPVPRLERNSTLGDSFF